MDWVAASPKGGMASTSLEDKKMSRMGISTLWGKFIVLVAVCGWCLPAQAKYGGGSGTEAEPFRISAVSDWQELMATPADWGSHFVLTTDIDLNDVPITPVGNDANHFTGVFDGNEHIIRNVDVNMPGSDYVGLFGYIDGGAARNLGLEGCSIRGGSRVGCLAGQISNGIVTNSYSVADVNATGWAVGGLVGSSLGIGRIANCYFSGDVNGSTKVGGLVGYNGEEDAPSMVTNTYSIGRVTGSGTVGGLLGYNGGIVWNCYSAGDVSGSSSVGGLVGRNYRASVSNCFWNSEAQSHGVTDSIGNDYYGTVSNVAGVLTADMQTMSMFVSAGWDFMGESANGTSETWQMDAGGSYPVLSFFHGEMPFPLAGSGTMEDPYLIGDANELGMVVWCPEESCLKLTRDIDLAGISWADSIVPRFSGCFDGDGHNLMNVRISGHAWLGVFGNLEEGGDIRNLGVEGGSVRGIRDYLGCLVGWNTEGSVSNCSCTGDVSGYRYVGGLVGNNGGIVSNCRAIGEISGIAYVGGLAGRNYDGAISRCYSAGDVNGIGALVGGLVGENDNYGIVSNCYCTGSTDGYARVGGLIGGNGSSGFIWNCYSTVDVNGVNTLGGLMGENKGVVSNCFWDTEKQAHGVTHSFGIDSGTVDNVVGMSTSEAQTQATYSAAGWDFMGTLADGTSETWQMPVCGGYPILSFFRGEIPYPLSGRGTASNPYVIGDAKELGMVNWYPVTSCFKLSSDLELAGINSREPAVAVFGGCFEGNSHRVANIRISGGGPLGVFGYVGGGAEVRDLVVEGGSVSGDFQVGGLAGISRGDMSNCSFGGDVTGRHYVGGLLGSNRGGMVSYCYSTGNVRGDGCLGGLVGGVHNGSVLNCYSSSNVGGTDEYVGGLVGLNGYPNYIFSTGTIENCYSTGDVNGIDCVGGLVGYMTSTSSSVSKCYSSGNVTGLASVAGLVGYNNQGSISDCSSLGSVHGTASVGGLVGSTYAGILSNCYSAGAVSGDRSIGGLLGYTFEGTVSESYSVGDVVGNKRVGGLVGSIRGSGRVLSSFSTGDVTGLEQVGGLVGKNDDGFTLESHSSGDVKGETQIGGLVGYGYYASVSRCYSISRVNGVSWVGGLVGYNERSSVSDSHSSGTVDATGSYVGGLVGEGGSAYDSYSTSDVNGVDDVGGLVGKSVGNVSRCYSVGDVSGRDRVGGLAGENYDTVSNCYSTGNISGRSSVGGLVGWNWYYQYGRVSRCYSAGDVNGIDEAGVLVGRNNDGAIVSSCFWDIETQGHGVTASIGYNKGSVANVLGLASTHMQTKSTFTSAAWDFTGETANGTDDIWTICQGTNYPRFVWQIPPGDIACPDGVNGVDFSVLGRYWHETDCAALDDCEGADIDLSGAVDFGDVAAVAESWLRDIR